MYYKQNIEPSIKDKDLLLITKKIHLQKYQNFNIELKQFKKDFF